MEEVIIGGDESVFFTREYYESDQNFNALIVDFEIVKNPFKYERVEHVKLFITYFLN